MTKIHVNYDDAPAVSGVRGGPQYSETLHGATLPPATLKSTERSSARRLLFAPLAGDITPGEIVNIPVVEGAEAHALQLAVIQPHPLLVRAVGATKPSLQLRLWFSEPVEGKTSKLSLLFVAAPVDHGVAAVSEIPAGAKFIGIVEVGLPVFCFQVPYES